MTNQEHLVDEYDVIIAFRVWVAGLPDALRVKVISLHGTGHPYFHDLIAKLPRKDAPMGGCPALSADAQTIADLRASLAAVQAALTGARIEHD